MILTDKKFRAWIESEKRMVYQTGACVDIQRFFRILPENAIIMQYTGLNDKNKKEIYEKDIWISGKNKGIIIEYECRWVILWNNGSYGDLYTNVTTSSLPDEYIAGNIFQKPELIQKNVTE